ncbi:MAG TPA: hypothetical protein PK397_10520 [Ignavibacteriaceae bacterium]|nr:hypothetical protein [Ignavibacteriaceae bacterium]
MSFRDQVKFLQELKRFEWKMTPKDKDEFKMFLKREKDEEEFDTVSMGKLKSLYEKYYLNREKKNFDHIFKKN